MRVRPYRPGDRDEVIGLLTSHRRSRRHGPDRETRLAMWDWQFHRHPFRWQDEPLIWVCEERGEIIGSRGGIPARIRIQGTVHTAFWGIDLMTHPDHRRRGVATAILRWCEEAHPLTFSTNMSDTVFRLEAGLGWIAAELPVVYRLRREDSSRPAEGKARSLGITELDDVPGEVDDLWARASRDHPAIFLRTAAFLRYRYLEHPLHRYVLLGAIDPDGLAGYLVFRTAGKLGFLVDCLALEDAEVLGALVDEALRRMGRAGVREVECWTTWSLFRQVLLGFGFKPGPEMVKFVCRAPEGLLPSGSPDRVFFLSRGDSDTDYW